MIQQRLVISLDNLTTDRELIASGSAVAVINASSASALIRLAGADSPSARTSLRLGLGVKGRGFYRLLGSWDAQPGQWVELVVWGEASDASSPELIVVPSLANAAGNTAFSSGAVAITDTDTVLATIYPAQGQTFCTFAVSNAGPDPIKEFTVQRQAYAGGPWLDYASETDGVAGGDFSGGTNDGVRTASNPGVWELTSGQNGDVDMNFFAAYAVRFVARCDTGDTATVTIAGQTCKG